VPLNPFAVRKASAVLERNVVAVIVGYFTAVILVLLSFGILMKISPELFPDLSAEEEPGVSILIITLVLGLLFAVVGGYIAAVIARGNEMKIGVALGLIMIVLGILTMFMEEGVKPLWWHGTSLVLLVPCTVLGASLRKKK